jgi:hypothetical protein
LGLQLSNLNEGFSIKKTTLRISSFAVDLFMSFVLGVLYFDKKTTIFSCTYEGIGIFVEDWKINLISLLAGMVIKT